jgi:hypothetical protein
MTVITPVKFPSDKDLQAYYSCDTLPAIPDNAAGTVYVQDAWATTDSWSGTACTLAVAAAKLTVTASATGAYRITRALSFTAKNILIKIKNVSGTRTAYSIRYTITTEQTETFTIPASGDFLAGIYLNVPGTATSISVRGDSTGAIGDAIEIDFIYIGSGLYDTVLSDDSDNANDGTVSAAYPCVGVNGNGIRFNGTNASIACVTPQTTGDFYIAFWGKYNELAGEDTIFAWGVWNANGVYAKSASGSGVTALVFSRAGAIETVSSAFTLTSAYAHYVIQYQYSTKTVYCYTNSALTKTSVLTNQIVLPPTRLLWGAYTSTSGNTACDLDEMRCGSRLLDPNEILGLYQQIVRPSYSNVALSSDRNRTSQANIFVTELTASGFNLVSVIDNYKNLMYEQSLSGVGTFSFSMLADSLQASAVKVNSFVIIGASYGLTQARVGIIQSVDRGISADSLQTINVTGFEAKGMLSWRIIVPNAGSAYYTITDDAETIFKDVLAHQGGASSADTSRIFTSLSIAPTQERGSTYVFAERYTNLASVFERLSLAAEMGWAIKWDATGLLFDVIVGKNRTIGNNVYAPAILSTNVDTVNESHFVENEQTYKTYNYVGGAGAGAARTIRTAYLGGSAPSSIARKEIFTDARDLASSSDLDSRGAAVLAENAYTRYVEATVNPFSLFMASSGAELGDYITVESSGYQQTCQITSITEQWGDNGYEMELKLDKQPNTIINAVTGQKLYTDRLAASLG